MYCSDLAFGRGAVAAFCFGTCWLAGNGTLRAGFAQRPATPRCSKEQNP
ncbi:hypothetical protein AOX55_0000543 [Sinorhizobium fredii CCBAU 25509]|nr:hypothetical protein SF83666_c04510 [Sinorhizobium fredii CCBAU 83666]AWM23822.1 hypothetical protein AOX55_0000543 [Sinorhizobium fredii CCBAU 25509]